MINNLEKCGLGCERYSAYDYDGLSLQELLCQFFTKINECIDDVNKYTEMVKEVINWVRNEGLEKEVRKVLQEWLAEGKFQEIIEGEIFQGFLKDLEKRVRYYKTVLEMEADKSISDGSSCITQGYYEPNDGGGAEYIKVGSEFKLIIKDNTINVKQLGAKPLTIDGIKTDLAPYIQKYLDHLHNNSTKVKLYIPSGIWYSTEVQLGSNKGIYIYGDENFSVFDKRANGTIITSMNECQDTIFKMGGSKITCSTWVLKNIIFSTADFLYDGDSKSFKYGNIKKIKRCVDMKYAEYGISDNLFFLNIQGTALAISSSWENYFNLLNFRNITSLEDSIMVFDTADNTLSTAPNITATYFGKIMFENVLGNLIGFKRRSQVYNNHFGVINVEPGFINNDIATSVGISKELPDNEYTHWALLYMEDGSTSGQNTFNSIELNSWSKFQTTISNKKYCYDTIVYYGEASTNPNTFNSITLNGAIKNCKALYMHENIKAVNDSGSGVTFGQFNTDSNVDFIFQVYGLTKIECLGKIKTHQEGYVYNKASTDLYINSGYIPCYKTMSKQNYRVTKGPLYYDAESYNPLNLVVKPNKENKDRQIGFMAVGFGKVVSIVAKVDSGSTTTLNINDLDTRATKQFQIVGTGKYKVYNLELNSGGTWNVGDKLSVEFYQTAPESGAALFDMILST